MKGKTLTFNKLVNNVYTTNDYSMFKMYEFNRTLVKTTILHLIRIMKGLLEEFGPDKAFIGCIVVVRKGKHLMIVDGQHRFNAACVLGIPLRYEIISMNEARIKKLIIDVNTSGAKWVNKDYIKANLNHENSTVRKIYETIVGLREQHGVQFSNLVSVITGESSLKSLKEGTITFDIPVSQVETALKQLNDYKGLGIKKAFVLRALTPILRTKEYAKVHSSILASMKRSKVNYESEHDVKKFITSKFNSNLKKAA